MIKKSIKLSTIELGTIATGLDLLLCWLPLRDHEQDQVVVIAEPKFLRHTYMLLKVAEFNLGIK